MLLFLFIKLRILFRFLFLHTSKDQLVTVVAVIQRTVYAADGGGGSSSLLGNLQICLAVLQHGSHFEPLGQRQQFVDSTQIFEETVAFLTGLQTQHRIKKGIYSVRFDFLFISDTPFHSCNQYNATISILTY